jgi:glycosyltransferase involved in cell wall biosynthesis
MARLRVCSLTTFYPPFNFGGDGIDVQRTARALVARGHEVTVVHDCDAYEWLAGRRHEDQPVDQAGVEVIGLRSRLGPLSPLLAHQLGRPVLHARALADLFRRRTFDVVLFNNVSLIGGPGLLSYGGDALKVYIAHEHWLVCPTHVLWRFNREPCDRRACARCVLRYRRPPQWWRYSGALARSLDEVDIFVARSEFSRAKHREFGFPKPMQVLPYFLPGDFPSQPEAPSVSRPHDRPYFLFVGRLERIKGLDTVIPAMASHPAADLVVIGDGEDADRLRRLSGAVPSVRFVGRVPNADLARYYQHALAVVVPSVGYETFGIVIIEALRQGTPVIARRIGPFTEIVESSGGGLLFSDETSMLDAMRTLQEDPGTRARCAAAGFAACRARWSEGAVIDQLLGMIRGGRRAA